MNNTNYYIYLIKKHSITFFITFSFVFSLVIINIYFAKNVYQSDASVEIVKYKQNNNEVNNALQIAIKESSPEDESEILKSNFLVNKTIKELGMNIEYYDFFRGKNHVIEKDDFPLDIVKFQIKNPILYNKNIQLIQISDKTYNLKIDTSTFMTDIKGSPVIKFNEIYEFAKSYSNDYFDILVEKKDLSNQENN
jgi:uncharacterized protein involved in exopolysaccharide biosynthesis